MPLSLITQADEYTRCRDRIALILANEIASQISLATADANADPEDYRVNVFTERFNPFDSSLKEDGDMTANVWFESGDFPQGKTDTSGARAHHDAVFNIDCIGLGKATETTEGHQSADERGARRAQWCASLIRKIIMSPLYTYLELDSATANPKDRKYWDRYTSALQAYQPQQDSRVIEGLHAVRVTIRVSMMELAEEINGETLEIVSVEIKRGQSGEVLANVDIDFTND